MIFELSMCGQKFSTALRLLKEEFDQSGKNTTQENNTEWKEVKRGRRERDGNSSTSKQVNKLTLNVLKTDFMVIGSRQRLASLKGEIALSLFNTELEKVRSVKCLGVNIDENLTWEDHMLSIRQKISCNLSMLKRIKPVLKLENLTHIYRSIIEP